MRELSVSAQGEEAGTDDPSPSSVGADRTRRTRTAGCWTKQNLKVVALIGPVRYASRMTTFDPLFELSSGSLVDVVINGGAGLLGHRLVAFVNEDFAIVSPIGAGGPMPERFNKTVPISDLRRIS